VRGRRVRESGPGEQKAPWRSPVVHGSTYEVPHLWQTLPLVDEHRSLTLQQAGWVGLGDGQFGGVIQTMHRLGALERCAGLPDALRAFDGNGRQVDGELIQLVVDDPALIRGKGAHHVAEYQTVMLKETATAHCKVRIRQTLKVCCGNS